MFAVERNEQNASAEPKEDASATQDLWLPRLRKIYTEAWTASERVCRAIGSDSTRIEPVSMALPAAAPRTRQQCSGSSLRMAEQLRTGQRAGAKPASAPAPATRPRGASAFASKGSTCGVSRRSTVLRRTRSSRSSRRSLCPRCRVARGCAFAARRRRGSRARCDVSASGDPRAHHRQSAP